MTRSKPNQPAGFSAAADYLRLVTFDFSASLWMHQGDAAWHFVTLPEPVADEIADLMQMTAGASKVQLHRARRRLRELLG